MFDFFNLYKKPRQIVSWWCHAILARILRSKNADRIGGKIFPLPIDNKSEINVLTWEARCAFRPHKTFTEGPCLQFRLGQMHVLRPKGPIGWANTGQTFVYSYELI